IQEEVTMSTHRRFARIVVTILPLIAMTTGRLAYAQLDVSFPPSVDPSALDPTNPNSELRKTLAHAADVIHGQIDSALGVRFSVTLRNPTDRPIVYRFNGQDQVALGRGMQVTH